MDPDIPDFTEGWARFITGKLEHQQVYGGHESIFREPHIARLADQLMQALESAYEEDREYQAQ